ncbi:MAG TPA: DUF4190 domain-containing protein [Acidimicrobiia bacterium]|nr:DUF4190 domain-containing protein [Acidimicrobiia bacterium]
MSDWPSDAWQQPPTAPPPSAAPPWAAQQPGWGPPPYDAGSYSGPPSNNGFAIASLVAGCAQLIFCGIGAILAIVFGHVARGQIKRSNGTQTGRGLATAGLVLGYIGLALTVLGVVAVIVVLFAFSDDITRHDMREDARAFIRSAQFEGFGSATGARDADALRETYLDDRDLTFDFDGDMYLADGTSIVTATDADWERNGWRFEMRRESPAGDVYVCATVPENVGDKVVVQNGPCLTGS